MAHSRKLCGRPIVADTGKPGELVNRCGYERMYGKQTCEWHWLLRQPAEVQGRQAANRLGSAPEVRVERVSKHMWPRGERWCSGCQSFVPLFYVSGSRCKACASTANHRAMVQKVYGIPSDHYDALYAIQGGRCYVCQRKSPSRRLAVDHDHETGEVRGLLCPDPDRGCNHKVVGPLEANSIDGGLAAARRLVAYLEDPPYARLLRQLENGLTAEGIIATERAARAPRSRYQPVGEGCTQPPPF